MMFSSKIIKGATLNQHAVAQFLFEDLQAEYLVAPLDSEEKFQPLFTVASDMTRMHAPEGALARQLPEEEHAVEESGPGAEELQQLLQEANDRGFADGRREAEESFTGICRTFAETVSEINGLRERIVRECEDDLLQLVITVAQQIIRQEISLDRKILARFVSEATAGISEQSDITIGFNPEDYKAVTANRQLYLAGIGDKMQVTIKPDEAVSPGGCIVDTQTGLVDARIETQLAEIFKRLMQERGHGSDESLELPAEAEQYLAEQCGAEKNGYQQH